MFKVIISLLLLILIFTGFVSFKVLVNDQAVDVDLALTSWQKEAGLSGYKKIPENGGMFFVFDKLSTPSFWMKNMNFPIDIIWIDKDKKIVGIEKNVGPESFPQTYQPEEPIKYVLETNAGWTDQNQIQLGEEIRILISFKFLGFFMLPYFF